MSEVIFFYLGWNYLGSVESNHEDRQFSTQPGSGKKTPYTPLLYPPVHQHLGIFCSYGFVMSTSHYQ